MRGRWSVSLLCLPVLTIACSSNPGEKTVARAEITTTTSEPLAGLATGDLLPTGARITPTAAAGSTFEPLNPDLPSLPDYLADHAVTTAVSPDGNTMLVLTSGYNLVSDITTGAAIPGESNEYVFVFDISSGFAVKRQVLQVPNTFDGIAWNPDGNAFYVSGGMNDNLHVFLKKGPGVFAESSPPIALGHTAGLGLRVGPVSAGVAVNQGGTLAVIANYENDSVSIIDLLERSVRSELDLRPGKSAPAMAGVPGGEYPFWVVIKGESKAYVSSQRDREVVAIDLSRPTPSVLRRIRVGGQPGKMILSRNGSRLYVANGSSDSIAVVDTVRDQVVEQIATASPDRVFENPSGLKGANPNSMALSHDERVLYVTNGGTNSVAVVRLDARRRHPHSEVTALIPTGWYPNSVSLGPDGSHLFVVNGKSNAGPACLDTAPPAYPKYYSCWNGNQYVWTLEKAGLLTLPIPDPSSLGRLTWQVAVNNHFPGAEAHSADREIMEFIRRRIEHVIYIIKENRTYDQVLGDLSVGNGDPSLAVFPKATTPNLHAIATRFVTLDNFRDSGETSGVGWNWTTAARTTDAIEKTQPVNYAGRGLNYDWEGTNRNINVGYATVAARVAANPFTPPDPDLLPGTADVSAPEAAGDEDDGSAYLWTAALRKGLVVRNYGVFGDLARSSLPPNNPSFIPLDHDPFAAGHVQFFPAKTELQPISDLYFRGYDNKYPDYWRFKEWEREFDGYAERGALPSLEFVRLPHDHTGSFGAAIDGVNTPDLQVADNDYAVGLLVDKVSKSRFAATTLIFVIEDDAQDGPDHVDAHRSTAFVAGPYVKQGAVVSAPYNTVSMVRTIEDVLGLEPLGLTDGLASPMSQVFEVSRRPNAWTYGSVPADILRTTALPLPPKVAINADVPVGGTSRGLVPPHSAMWWERVMKGQDFSREDNLDVERFNRALWHGLMGDLPYPTVRGGPDLSKDRDELLKTNARRTRG